MDEDEILGVLTLKNPWDSKRSIREKSKGIHTEYHALAHEISNWCSEKNYFAKYLGVLMRKGLPWGYKTFSEMKQYQSKLMNEGKWLKNPGALFMSKAKKDEKSPVNTPVSLR